VKKAVTLLFEFGDGRNLEEVEASLRLLEQMEASREKSPQDVGSLQLQTSMLLGRTCIDDAPYFDWISHVAEL
jgi:hypothetical protein